MVGLACDRAIHGGGIEVKFLGEATVMPSGAAELALRTGSTILCGFNVRIGHNKYRAFFEPPMVTKQMAHSEENVRALTEQIIAIIETYLRRFPGQWIAFQPIWNSALQPTAREARTAMV